MYSTVLYRVTDYIGLSGQASEVGDAGGRQPRRAVYKLGDGEVASLLCSSEDVVSGPTYSPTQRGARPVVHVLAVVERI